MRGFPALLSVIRTLLGMMFTLFLVYMWATSHDPNYGIGLILVSLYLTRK